MPEILPNIIPFEGIWFLIATIITILGLILGSFTSAMIHRIPNGQSVFGANDRSACTHCHHTLATRDLIPLFSWLATKGHCRHCNHPISKLYPALELTTALLAFLTYIICGPNITTQLITILAAIPILMAMCVIDIRHKILPNKLMIIWGALGAIYVTGTIATQPENLSNILINHLGGMAFYAIIVAIIAFFLTKALKRKSLGMGDVKFFGVAGLWLGMAELSIFCMMSGIFGVVLGMAWKKIFNEPVFPFGPALIVSFFIILLMKHSNVL